MLRYNYHNGIAKPGGVLTSPGTSQEYESMTTPQSTPTQNLPQEEWRAVDGYEGIYEVSNHGRVRRIVAGGRTWHVPHVMTPVPTGNGYRCVTLSRDSKGHTRSIHRLVAAAFLGPCPASLQVDHKDGDRANNAAWNLEYVTGSENSTRALKNGQCGYVKLSEADVRNIRALYASGLTQVQIADRYGVFNSTISNIITRKAWKHVDASGVR